MDKYEHFFDFAAEVGLTKHIGGVEATDELIRLCQIDAGHVLLDAGCGVGATPIYIAQKVGCRVVGIDIRLKMIERSRESARRAGLSEQVEFKVADVQELPYEDGLFDAVISESVTAFPPDKQKAVNEYVRVTKTGGYIGLNESTWLKTPPPQEMIDWVSQDVGATVTPLTEAEWAALLDNAGLFDITTQIYKIDVRQEAKKAVARYGLGGTLRQTMRAFRLYLHNPNYREFLKNVSASGIAPKNLSDYFGYGIFVGRKPG